MKIINKILVGVGLLSIGISIKKYIDKKKELMTKQKGLTLKEFFEKYNINEKYLIDKDKIKS